MKKVPRRPRVRPEDKRIGNRIRQARMAAGFNQEELGKACGITYQQIQKVEAGVNRVSVLRLVDIARATKHTITFFCDGIEGHKGNGRPNVMEQFGAAPGGLRLAQAFVFSDIPGRRLLIELGEYIAAVAEEDGRAGPHVGNGGREIGADHGA